VSGGLDKKDKMAQVMRSLDAVGSLILDFAYAQKIVGVWATLMDPFKLQFGEEEASYDFEIKAFAGGIEQSRLTQQQRSELEKEL